MPGPAIQTLQRALQRHRLIFLWYAHPAHRHVPDRETPDKGDLYDRLDLAGCGVGKYRPADDVFKFAAVIDLWLAEQQAALGTGRGKPLEIRPWPAQHNAYWVFQPGGLGPLQASSDLIARLVGAALTSPRPDWLGPDDVPLVRACGPAALPVPTEEELGHLWTDQPQVVWDYPDQLQREINALERLVLVEQGASGTITPATSTPAVEPITHSDDFTSVTAFGRSYQFSKGQQADVMRVLILAYLSGNPTLSEEMIGEKIRSSSSRFRMAHVFRSKPKAGTARKRNRKPVKSIPHEAWKTLIYSPQRGLFAIRNPDPR